MLGEDVLYLTVRELGDRVRTKQVSPVELTESYLQRSERLNPQLNCYVTITRDLALQEAYAAEEEIAAGKYRGPLHGIPYAAKDLLAVKGYPTTWGARPYANQKFDFNATLIEKLNQAGAVLIGKAAMIELAGAMNYRYASASITGAAKNPWNEGCWTCGSSSGSAAIAAGAMAGFAIGSETWGSIICPSAFCGVSGLRPTFGRVSRYGCMALAYSQDKLGPLARSADDCALVLAAIAAHDPLDRSSLPASEAAFSYSSASTGSAAGAADASALRVGWLTNAWESPTEDIRTAARGAVELLQRNGAKLADAKLPEGPYEAAAATVVAVEGAAAFKGLIDSGRVAYLSDPLGQVNGYINQQVSASDYMLALQIRGICQHRVDKLFESFDVIAAPSLPIAATTIDANLETGTSFADPLGGIGNLCGLPAISVPVGLNRNNLPIGVQFVARARNDHAVVAAARLLQQHSSWHRSRPPLS
jgi:aspartyl-tRNA(Asn)/glutamyl-tRNA(Gln) amidotransferase subunit A